MRHTNGVREKKRQRDEVREKETYMRKTRLDRMHQLEIVSNHRECINIQTNANHELIRCV